MNIEEINKRKLQLMAERAKVIDDEINLLNKLECVDKEIPLETDKKKDKATDFVESNEKATDFVESNEKATDLEHGKDNQATDLDGGKIRVMASEEDISDFKLFCSSAPRGNYRPVFKDIPLETIKYIVDFNVSIGVAKSISKDCKRFGVHNYISNVSSALKTKNHVICEGDKPIKWIEENGEYIKHAIKNKLSGTAFENYWPRRKHINKKKEYTMDSTNQCWHILGGQIWPMKGVKDTVANKKIVERTLAFCIDIDDYNSKQDIQSRGMFFTHRSIFLEGICELSGKVMRMYGTRLQACSKNITRSHYDDTNLPSVMEVKGKIKDEAGKLD